ncbi:MAG: hypothetical protein IJT80_05530 [Lachnospiraceae bacterium]|nr:hypothetical protein [Lachnospiraceae bacterium]
MNSTNFANVNANGNANNNNASNSNGVRPDFGSTETIPDKTYAGKVYTKGRVIPAERLNDSVKTEPSYAGLTYGQ